LSVPFAEYDFRQNTGVIVDSGGEKEIEVAGIEVAR
jgi:hypothetical protein